MAKTVNRKSLNKTNENQHSFVKNRGGFHPESDQDLKSFSHPGPVEHDYSEFRRTQGQEEAGADAPRVQELRREGVGNLIGNIYILARHPLRTARKVIERYGYRIDS